jgi:hypothetical protein
MTHAAERELLALALDLLLHAEEVRIRLERVREARVRGGGRGLCAHGAPVGRDAAALGGGLTAGGAGRRGVHGRVRRVRAVRRVEGRVGRGGAVDERLQRAARRGVSPVDEMVRHRAYRICMPSVQCLPQECHTHTLVGKTSKMIVSAESETVFVKACVRHKAWARDAAKFSMPRAWRRSLRLVSWT